MNESVVIWRQNTGVGRRMVVPSAPCVICLWNPALLCIDLRPFANQMCLDASSPTAERCLSLLTNYHHPAIASCDVSLVVYVSAGRLVNSVVLCLVAMWEAVGLLVLSAGSYNYRVVLIVLLVPILANFELTFPWDWSFKEISESEPNILANPRSNCVSVWSSESRPNVLVNSKPNFAWVQSLMEIAWSRYYLRKDFGWASIRVCCGIWTMTRE